MTYEVLPDTVEKARNTIAETYKDIGPYDVAGIMIEIGLAAYVEWARNNNLEIHLDDIQVVSLAAAMAAHAEYRSLHPAPIESETVDQEEPLDSDVVDVFS